MEARAKSREPRRTAPLDGPSGYATAATVADAYERYTADLHDLVRELVEDDEKATRILQAAFIAASQALAVGAEHSTAATPGSPGPISAGVGPCPKLGYADNPDEHYSRATQQHRCYVGGSAGTRVSTQEQNLLCLTGGFDGCPRLGGKAGAPAAQGTPIELGVAGTSAEPLRLRPRVVPHVSLRRPSEPSTAIDEAPASPVSAGVTPTADRHETPPSAAAAASGAGQVPPLDSAPNNVGSVAPTDAVLEAEAEMSRAMGSDAADHSGTAAVVDPPAPPGLRRLITGQFAVLGAVAVAAVVVGVGIIMMLRLWDETDGLPSEQDIARVVSVAPNRDTGAPTAADASAAARDVAESLVVPSLASAQSAPAVSPSNQPAPSSQAIPNADAEARPAAAQAPRAPEPTAVAPATERETAVARKTTHAPAGFTSANLRERPSTTARSLVVLPNGTPVDVLPDTATGDGFTWVRARTPEGVVGWVVSTAVGG
jgi:Bacterial SH3 domain